jgi:pimeloyl-ACP methyl ester carboxylesterase
MHTTSLHDRSRPTALALCLLLAACGSDDAASTGATDAATTGGTPAPGGAGSDVGGGGGGGGPEAGAGGAGGSAAPDATAPALDASPRTCDETHPPVVMAHGLLASGDTYSAHVRRFAANGECPDRFHAFDWNTLNRAHDHAGDLDAFIEAVRARHGAEQVDLVGHSAGGGLGYTYLANAARAAKVRRYVHVGSGPMMAPAGPADGPAVPTLNLWSRADLVVAGEDIPGATNVALETEDHYAVATSPASFEAMYRFLRGDAAPETADPTGTSGADGRVEVAGRVVILGDNTPDAGSTVQVFALDPASGARQDDTPEATFSIVDDGAFGPFEADTGTRYEFLITSPREGARPVRYFHRPFASDDRLIYLRTLPTTGLPGALLNGIPFEDAHSVVVVYLARGAMLAGRDTLEIDGENVATEAIAAADDTTIALFVYDEGKDRMNAGSTAAFEAFPFLAGLDRFIEADATRTLTLRFNGVALDIPRRPSGTDGASIVVFD